MVILSASGITKAYGTDVILSDISFHVEQGDRVGLIGSNGAGKTTLFSILTGELEPDSGRIYRSSDVSVGYLKQKDNFASEGTIIDEMMGIFRDLEAMEKEMAALSARIAEESAKGANVETMLHQYDDMTVEFSRRNGYSFRSEVRGILNSMAFPEESFRKKISTLSGGERTRLALAALLLKKPDLLLLDEPTNHLDIGTLKWLEQYLRSYSGTILLVSHDRYFLDQAVNRIMKIENHKLTAYDGNYTVFLEKERLQREDDLRHYEEQQREIRKQEDLIRSFKQRGTEKLANRAKSREKRLAHVERMERPENLARQMHVSFQENYQSGNDVLYGEDLSKSFTSAAGRRTLFEHLSMDVKRGERVGIVGQNGIGKTTLLRIITGTLYSDTGRLRFGQNVEIAYYDQEQQMLTGSNTVLEELHEAYRLYSETRLRSLLGRFLFTQEDVFKLVGDLSGGEKARLALLKIMLSGANLLIMDEPTNHLDIASKEVFEDALLEFPGTLLAVSHDRYFLNKVPTRIMELTENGADNYLGGYDYYTEKKQSLASGKSYLQDLGKKGVSPSVAGVGEVPERVLSEKELRREERKRAKEQEAAQRRHARQTAALEAEIAECEERIRTLEEEMCHPELLSDYQALNEKNQELGATKERLNMAYEAWIELQEE